MSALPALLLLALAGALALARARRDRDAWPVAALLAALLTADLTRLALGALLLSGARLRAGEAPYEGVARAAFRASGALHLLWPVGCAGVAAALWTRLRGAATRVALAAWACASVALAAGYPGLRGEALLSAYRGVQAASVAAGFAGVALAARPAGLRPGGPHLCALLLLAGCAAELAGPYLSGAAHEWWWLAQATWPVALAGCCLALVGGRPWATARA